MFAVHPFSAYAVVQFTLNNLCIYDRFWENRMSPNFQSFQCGVSEAHRSGLVILFLGKPIVTFYLLAHKLPRDFRFRIQAGKVIRRREWYWKDF